VIRRNGAEEYLEGDFYVNTTPLADFIRTFPEDTEKTIIAASASLRSLKLVLLYLILKKSKVAVPMEIFFADPEIPFKRIYEPGNLMPGSAPPGRTSLCLEICTEEGEDINRAELYARSVNGLKKYGLVDECDILHHFYREVPDAYPQYRQGFEKDRMRLYRFISGIPNLISTGRQGLFKYGAMTHQVMEMARGTAEHILSGPQEKAEPVDGPDLPFV
jgi:protoporphyrinogen oxidase